MRMRELIDFPLRNGVLLTLDESNKLIARGVKSPVVREILAARQTPKPKTPKEILGNHRCRVKRELQRMFEQR